MAGRAEFEVPFADGGVLHLGRKTCVMGVINVTPDSFSDGGKYPDADAAADAAAAMVADGADLIDVGGESTRPGAEPLNVAEEAERILPVVEQIKRRLEVRVSVDTMKAEVARRALDAGADLINDISGLGDPGMLDLVARCGVPVVVMHMRGTPQTMQRDTAYDNLLSDVVDFLHDSVQRAVDAGVSDDKIVVDPGIGFGKSSVGSLQILRLLPTLTRVKRPILIGASRKSFIGSTLDQPVNERLEGSLAVAAYASAQGAHVIRAHDVAATVRVVRMIDAIREVEPAQTRGASV
jgi:dihydropteroate synthase